MCITVWPVCVALTGILEMSQFITILLAWFEINRGIGEDSSPNIMHFLAYEDVWFDIWFFHVTSQICFKQVIEIMLRFGE